MENTVPDDDRSTSFDSLWSKDTKEIKENADNCSLFSFGVSNVSRTVSEYDGSTVQNLPIFGGGFNDREEEGGPIQERSNNLSLLLDLDTQHHPGAHESLVTASEISLNDNLADSALFLHAGGQVFDEKPPGDQGTVFHNISPQQNEESDDACLLNNVTLSTQDSDAEGSECLANTNITRVEKSIRASYRSNPQQNSLLMRLVHAPKLYLAILAGLIGFSVGGAVFLIGIASQGHKIKLPPMALNNIALLQTSREKGASLTESGNALLAAPPTSHPSVSPSAMHSTLPSATPSKKPSVIPSFSPSKTPSVFPTFLPSPIPTITPTLMPSSIPTKSPTGNPSDRPTLSPSVSPSNWPSLSHQPTLSGMPTWSSSLSFYAVGETPLDIDDAEKLRRDLANIPHDETGTTFVVHLGDVQSARETQCIENEYIRVKNIFHTCKYPMLIVPGENDYKDCPTSSKARQYWDQYLSKLEQHWANKANYGFVSQIKRQGRRPENWSVFIDDVMFIGVSILGGAMESKNRWTERLDDDLQWVRRHIEKHRSEMAALVVFGHSYARARNGEFFEPFREESAALGLPVLYVHSDGNGFDISKVSNSSWSVQVDRGRDAPPLRISFLRDALEPFKFDRRK